jgi:hypothetical protein
MIKYKNIGKIQKLENGVYLIDERLNNKDGGVYLFDKDSLLYEYIYFNSDNEVIYDEKYKNGKVMSFQGSPMVVWYSEVDSAKQDVSLNLFLSTLNKEIDSPTLFYKGKYYNLNTHNIENPLQSNLKFISIHLNGVKKSDFLNRKDFIIFTAKYSYCNGVVRYVSDTF